MRLINDAGAALIKSYETKRLLAYDDKRPDYVLQPGDHVEGTLTNGWGHTGPDVFIGQVIDDSQADAWFLHDTMAAEDSVANRVSVDLNDNQFSALCSFVFNVGDAQFAKSTLLTLLNKGDYASVSTQLRRFVYSKGVREPGLERRRAAEAELFLRPMPSDAPPPPAPKPEVEPAKSVVKTKTAGGLAAAGAGGALQQAGDAIKDSAGAHQWLLWIGTALLVAGLLFALYGRWDALQKAQAGQ
jgi:lysozyme